MGELKNFFSLKLISKEALFASKFDSLMVKRLLLLLLFRMFYDDYCLYKGDSQNGHHNNALLYVTVLQKLFQLTKITS